MKRNTIKSSDLKGRHIFRENNRTYYYDPFKKITYQVTNADAKTYIIFETRIPLAILVGLCIAYFLENYVLAIVAALLIEIIMFVLFRIFFVKKLMPSKIEISKNNFSIINLIIENNSKKKILANAIVMFILSAFIIVNVFLQNFTLEIEILNYAFGILFFVISILHIIAFVKKKD